MVTIINPESAVLFHVQRTHVGSYSMQRPYPQKYTVCDIVDEH